MASILVIAEDLKQRREWRRLFVHVGYAVIDAREEREAVHYCQQHVIDLILLELQPPAAPGLATLQALRTAAPEARLLVLWDTGFMGQDDAGLLTLRPGADQVLQQSVEHSYLLAAVRSLLAES